ncbi:myelin-associated glycoprotein [Eudromia elegans]
MGRAGTPTLVTVMLVTVTLVTGAAAAGSWAAWMPATTTALEGACALVPCRFSYPPELRPAAVHGLWFFGSPYPRSYPPVVARSHPGRPVHESFEGRARLAGALPARDCSLLLPRAAPELAGRYYFRGDLGGYNQFTFPEHTELRVLAAPLLTLPPALVAGQAAELSCHVPVTCPGPRPALALALLHAEADPGADPGADPDDPGDPDAEAAPQRDVPGGTERSLRLLPRPRHRRSRLRCRASDGDRSYEAAAPLHVLYPPRVLALRGPREVTEGSPLELLCGARGHPPPQLSWLRPLGDPLGDNGDDGATVEELLNVTAGEDPPAGDMWDEEGPEAGELGAIGDGDAGDTRWLRLRLPRAAPGDGGAFVCAATNALGGHNRSATLRVRHAPRAPQVTGPPSVAAGEAAAATATLTLALAPARPRDGGRYVCEAENGLGRSRAAWELRVLSAGRPPPAVTFEVPGRNVSAGPGHASFAPGPPPGEAAGGAADVGDDVGDDDAAAGVTVTALLTLRGPLEPRLAVLCSARNALGAAGRRLRVLRAEGLVWAKVGPVGAVVASAVVIAGVCYAPGRSAPPDPPEYAEIRLP